jgi:hypothetical protein
MANVVIPPGKFKKMIEACEDMQARIPANGVPELDVEFSEMIVLMHEAYDEALGPTPEQQPT